MFKFRPTMQLQGLTASTPPTEKVNLAARVDPLEGAGTGQTGQTPWLKEWLPRLSWVDDFKGQTRLLGSSEAGTWIKSWVKRHGFYPPSTVPLVLKAKPAPQCRRCLCVAGSHKPRAAGPPGWWPLDADHAAMRPCFSRCLDVGHSQESKNSLEFPNTTRDVQIWAGVEVSGCHQGSGCSISPGCSLEVWMTRPYKFNNCTCSPSGTTGGFERSCTRFTAGLGNSVSS